MGEAKRKLVKRKESIVMLCGANGGSRVQVRWEAESAATPMGQLAYFIEFLTLSGLWSRWIESCPLATRESERPRAGRSAGDLDAIHSLRPSPLCARDRHPL
ncbi:MAG: hypothetical protein U1F55_12015 [Chitinivorax sp.]